MQNLIKASGQLAAKVYLDKKYSCGESVVFAIRETIVEEMPAEFISACSGFAAGIGRSEGVCGALLGGVICLGYCFGRRAPSDERAHGAGVLAAELRQAFLDKFSLLECSDLSQGLDKEKGEHKGVCAEYVKFVAEKTAEIILREKA